MSINESSNFTAQATGLNALQREKLEIWVATAKSQSQSGKLPDYIPKLALANPTEFALQIQNKSGQIHSLGNLTLSFPLMSVVKPFLLLYLLEELGFEAVFERVGMEPSDQPFNSLIQLQADRGWPRNPMINSGAIALASMLPGQEALTKCENLRSWLNQQANCQLFLDELMLASVNSNPNQRNQALAFELVVNAYIEDAKIALETYNYLCCLSGTIVDLARLGMLLVESNYPTKTENSRTVKALMTTCGLYQASGHFAVRVGLPTKSGVSGAMLAIVPSRGAIACYSPLLNAEGNSVAGLFVLEKIAQTLNLSVFD